MWLHIAQYADWDLKKTSNTLAGTLTGLFLMAYRLKIKIVWNPTLKGKFLKIPGRGIEPGTLKITNGGHPSKYWLGSMLLNFSDRTLKLSSVEPSQYLDGWPPGNTGCCWQSFFVIIFKICNFFFGGGVDILTRLEYPTFFSTYVKHDRYFWVRLRKKLRVCGTLLYIASKKYMCTLIYATWDFIASMKNMCTLIFAS